MSIARSLLLLGCFAACGDDDAPAASGDAGRDAGNRGDLGPSALDASGPAADGAPAEDTSIGRDASVENDAVTPRTDAGPSPSGAAAYRGRLLFAEPFVDDDFGSRDWYDSNGGDVVGTDNAPGGSGGSLACRFTPGASGCEGGTPARHPIEEVEAVLLSFWVKHSPDWVGSGRAYHPHLFQLVTNVDDDYVGPASTHLTLLVEHVGGRGLIALTDTLNTDTACILRNDDSFVGCGGDFASYAFSEMRSVAACNGIAGDLDGRDCFDNGGGQWYSARLWRTPEIVFSPDSGPTFQGDWHHVEAYFAMSSIADGIGIPDGRIRYWVDDVLLVSFERILFRTGAYPDMRLDQLLLLPYIGDGSPIDQTIFIDEIELYEGARP